MEAPLGDLGDERWDPGRAADEEAEMPTVPPGAVGHSFDVSADATFWEKRHILMGGVIEVTISPEEADASRPPGRVALLVKSWSLDEAGIWVEPKLLGSSEEWA